MELQTLWSYTHFGVIHTLDNDVFLLYTNLKSRIIENYLGRVHNLSTCKLVNTLAQFSAKQFILSNATQTHGRPMPWALSKLAPCQTLTVKLSPLSNIYCQT